jgi:hypothetical protein
MKFIEVNRMDYKDWTDWMVLLAVLMPALGGLVYMQVYMAKDAEDSVLILIGGVAIIFVCLFGLPFVDRNGKR